MKLKREKVIPIIEVALKEDIGRGDVTTDFLIPDDLRIKATIIAREKGIIAGISVARWIFNIADAKIQFTPIVEDGRQVRKNETIAMVEGPAKSILISERVILNFLARLSGIATLTHKYVQKVKPSRIKIMDTRKTTPGLRYLEKYAVRVGGGYNHRMGLYDQVLIKENHFRALGPGLWTLGLDEARKKIPKKMLIEVEVENLGQFKKALKIGADIIMLDNMSVIKIRRAVKLRDIFYRKPLIACPKSLDLARDKLRRGINHKPLLEVSGNVTLANVRKIVSTGVDVISIGSLTHSVRSLDIALEVIK